MPDTDLPGLQLNDQLCFPLYAASNLMVRLYRPLLDEIGLTYPQYLVMLALWETAPRTVGELGVRLYLDSGTLTPLLKRLEGAGLVTRRRDAEDERRVLIQLTPAGAALRTQAEHIPESLLCRIGLPLDDAFTLRDELKKLIGILLYAAPHVPAQATEGEPA